MVTIFKLKGEAEVGHGSRDEGGGDKRRPAEHGRSAVLELAHFHLLLLHLRLGVALEGVVERRRLPGLLVLPLGRLGAEEQAKNNRTGRVKRRVKKVRVLHKRNMCLVHGLL